MNIQAFQRKESLYCFVKSCSFGITWESFYKIVRLIRARVKFPCNFVAGKCAGMQKPFLYGKRACCYSCAYNLGFLDKIPVGSAFKYFKLFNTKTGFWRPNKGCILPYKMRSITCLGFYCGSGIDYRNLPEGFKSSLSQSYDLIHIHGVKIKE